MLKEEKDYTVREMPGARGFFVSRVKALLAVFVLVALVIILIVLAPDAGKRERKEGAHWKRKKRQ